MKPIRKLSATTFAAALAGLALTMTSASAGVVFSESFEAPVVIGFDDNTVPSNGKWIGATQGFGATDRGLYNETFSWPATAAFTTPYGSQAYYINYSNSGLTTSVGATGLTLAAGVTYELSFNAAVAVGTASGSYRVELVAFGATDTNTARANAQTLSGTILATATGTVTTNDLSATGSLTFTPDGANAHLGKDLGIRLIKATNSVLYDNIRLVTGHDMLPSPASGVGMPAGNTALSWTNMPPNTPGGNVPVDVWFGTNPAALTQVVDGVLTSTTNVSAPVAGTYYWRVDSYPDGNPNGIPVTGDLFFFVVTDTDSDGLPDAYELANTNPSSPTALVPASDLDSDGLTAAQEYFYGTDPNDNDTDNDTLIDGPELAGVGLRPATSPVDADSDDDGLSDGVETNTGTWVSAANTGTNPVDADWDNDGLSDGAETNTGTYVDRFTTGSNPFLADTDADGATDWYEAVATFTNPSSGASGQTSPLPYPLPDPDGLPGNASKPVKVYIMAGQSNTVGIGQVNGTSLGTLETAVKRENKFPNLVDGSNNWTKRNDVIYRGVISADGNNGPLTAGQGASNVQLGPELGFGQIMGWYHDEPVLIIKASQGNRSLAWDFCPPGNVRWTNLDKTYAAYGESTGSWLTATGAPAPTATWYAGKQYDDCLLAESDMGMNAWQTGISYILTGNGSPGSQVRHNGVAYICKVAHTSDASTEPGVGANWGTYWNVYTITNASDFLNFGNGTLQNLPTLGDNLNGRTFEIAGFCWWQGHKDQDGSNNPYATQYEANLVKLINALRADFNAPNAPVVVASIGFGGEPLSTKENDFKQVYNAQMAVGNPALHPEFSGTVKSVDILKYWRLIDESPKAQDFHYNQNAETYMLVGDAMGRAMLSMQNDVAPPSPSPMTFALAPTAVNTTTVGMVATTAIDISGPVQYWFENTSNSTNSGWITSTRWDSTGLTNGVSYNFRVKAKDNKDNETQWSATASAAPGSDVTAPTPNPMSFAAPFTVLGENSIAMTASTATDINGVQYEFVCTVGGGPGSGWQSSPDFTPTGLTPATAYTYVVRARDAGGNTTANSASSSATTTSPDTSPPTPTSMSFASPPTALGTDAISMIATTASDPSGVEYFFDETSGNPGGTDSGWQNTPSYSDSGLQPGTQYSYTVRARDKSPAQNLTTWSPGASATTQVPDTTNPLAISFNPSNGTSNVPVTTNLVIAFDEEIALGTGLITLKNLTDATQSTIDVQDGTQVSAAGTVLTINPTASLAYNKNYAIQLAATAIDDLSDNGFAGITNDTTWAFTTASEPSGPGGALIYEPFADSDPTLNGNAGGTGLTGSWTATSVFTVTSPSLSYHSLPVSGNKVSYSSGNAGASVGITTGTLGGLLSHGSTLWFSTLINTPSAAGTNEDTGFAIGTDPIPQTAMQSAIGVNKAALGWTIKSGKLQASIWNQAANVRGTNGPSVTVNTTILVVGKITWGADGASADTIELYLPDANLNLGAVTASASAVFDQASFDTISTGLKNNTNYGFDEIRFGSSYENAIGLGGSGPGPLDHFAISAIASPQTVGTPITGITLTAQDAANATVTGFTGTVTFGGSGGFSGTSGNFVAGVLTGVSATPTVAGSNLTLTVTDGATPTPHTGSATIATIQSAYNGWAGAAAFNGDANGDGVKNGLAWLLGATDKDVNATVKLPLANQSGGNLVLNFTCLKVANRGGAVLKVQSSNDLGATDPWTSHEAVVPDASATVNGVAFVTSPNADPKLINVQATIPDAPGTKLFGRLSGTP